MEGARTCVRARVPTDPNKSGRSVLPAFSRHNFRPRTTTPYRVRATLAARRLANLARPLAKNISATGGKMEARPLGGRPEIYFEERVAFIPPSRRRRSGWRGRIPTRHYLESFQRSAIGGQRCSVLCPGGLPRSSPLVPRGHRLTQTARWPSPRSALRRTLAGLIAHRQAQGPELAETARRNG